MQPSHGERFFAPHPLALMFAALAVGIAVAHLRPIHLVALVTLFSGSCLLSLWFLVRQCWFRSTVFVVLATLSAGAALEAIANRASPATQIKRLIEAGTIKADEPVEIIGVLDRPPEYTPDGFYLTLRVEQLRFAHRERVASGVVQLFVAVRDDRVSAAYEELQLHYGARVRVISELVRADNYRNPGVSSLTEFLDRKGYDATGKLKSPLLVERLNDARVFAPLRWLYEWRRTLELAIRRHFSAETAGVLDAALLGNRYFLSRGAAERFREGGTFHVLVISGLHISFIGGLVLLIARRITKKAWLRFVLAAVVLWGYTLAVGAESSVVRSAMMFSLVALAPVVSRRASSLNALGGAGLFLLLCRPGDLFDPSFQLTFLSVLAIVAIAIPLLRKLAFIGEWQPTRENPYPPACPNWLRVYCEAVYWNERQWRREMANANYSYRLFKAPLAAFLQRYHLQQLLRHSTAALIVSASVQVSLLPLLILYFHRLSVSSLLLNIFVSALMGMLGLAALAALALVQFSALLAAPLFVLADKLNWLMVHSVDLFDALGTHSLRLPEYSGWPATAYAIYYLPLAVLVWKLSRWFPLAPRVSFRARWLSGTTKVAATLQILLFGLIVFHPFSADRSTGRLRIDFLDVGQGDAALVTMPDGTTLLIDGGGRPSFGAAKLKGSVSGEPPFERDTRSIGEAVVSEYLWWRGLDRLDYILATHADADHIDGLNDVARNFEVRAALVARTPAADPEYSRFADTMRRVRVPVNIIGAGDVLHFGSTTAIVFWPPLNTNNDAPSGNNDSIVLRLEYGQRTLLMTGDVEKEGEAALVAAGANLNVDVVKVPHHGSKTSSTESFVKATQARLAVISVGLTSMFGHPRPEVVERWKAAGAEVITTGRRGTITVSTDGTDLRVDSFVH